MLLELRWFPDHDTVKRAMANDDPLLLLVSFDRSEALVANVDDALEHAVLLRRMGRNDTEIDRFFRAVVNRSGADWTFAVPSEYGAIRDRARRIETFYGDGIDAITEALTALGYDVPVRIPERYRRHWDAMRNGNG